MGEVKVKARLVFVYECNVDAETHEEATKEAFEKYLALSKQDKVNCVTDIHTTTKEEFDQWKQI